MAVQRPQTLEGNVVDVQSGEIFQGEVLIEGGLISRINRKATENSQFILPGLIDSHVHVESSMLIPQNFARIAVRHGTVGTVSDPHEIANVLGVKGIEYMLDDARRTPFKFMFGVPSCVPATPFESSGATIGVEEVAQLFRRGDMGYLAEVMNFDGVLARDELLMAKIEIARAKGKRVDGHAPGLRGDDARKYISAGISTDHECFTAEEALDKIRWGMRISIREGSAAKNFDALIDLIDEFPEFIMLCSDDKHPDSLVEGHIDRLVQRALARGHDTIKVIRAATKNPVEHYGMNVGLLQQGDPADLITVRDLESFQITSTYIDGTKVAQDGESLLQVATDAAPINNFTQYPVRTSDIAVRHNGGKIRVIEAIPGELITRELIVDPTVQDGFIVGDPDRDILKLVNVNRYEKAPPAVAFVKNMGLRHGAIAGSVGHDSHNILAAGASDDEICRAIELVMKHRGGLVLCAGEEEIVLPLDVAGLMSREDGDKVAKLYTALDSRAKELGSQLPAPYMTLSFLALLVIPELKLSDKGLFSTDGFSFRGLEV
ncbi:MAG: adenine deaminase [Bdellovibrionales bacterium]|nr:adenine deaminase [Bdellovibrionales bacterium]